MRNQPNLLSVQISSTLELGRVNQLASILSIAAATVVFSSGCSSSTEEPVGAGGASSASGGASSASGGAPGTDPTFAEISTFVEDTCAMAGCHGETVPTDPNAFASYLPELLPGPDLPGTLTTFLSPACGNVPLIAPGNSAGSAIVMLATGQCGDASLPTLMPYECFEAPCLEQPTMTMLSTWIDAGASFD